MPQLNVRVELELLQKLERLRKEKGVSIAHLARVALEEKADQLLAGGRLPPNPVRGWAAAHLRDLGKSAAKVALQSAPVVPVREPRAKPTKARQKPTIRPPEPTVEVWRGKPQAQAQVPAPAPPQAPIQPPIRPPRGPLRIHHDQDEQAWVSVDEVAARLGIETSALLVQLDPEDFRTFGGETCISSFGINTAIGMARIADKDTSAFELELQRDPQAT